MFEVFYILADRQSTLEMAQNDSPLKRPARTHCKKYEFKGGEGADNLPKEREFSRRLLKISVLAYVFNVK